MNVVSDALSRKPSFMMMTQQKEMQGEIIRLDLEIILQRYWKTHNLGDSTISDREDQEGSEGKP